MILSTLLILASLPSALAADDVTVHLRVTTVAGVPTFAECDVTVPAGSTVEAVLDQAREDACISEWHCTDFEFDCFVDSINNIPGAGVFYWAFYENGAMASTGIRGATVSEGADYTFELDQWAVFPSPI